MLQKSFDKGAQSTAYTELLMEETEMEQIWRSEVQNDKDASVETKQKKMAKLEDGFWHRRLINADYWKELKALLLTHDYI